MAVKLRLTRTGANKDVCFRVIAADSRSARDGKFIENLGWYNPGQTGRNFKVKLDRIDYWLSEGAQASDTVRSLVRKARKDPADETADVIVTPEEKQEEIVTEEPVESAETVETAEVSVETDADGVEPVSDDSEDKSETTELVEDEPKTVED